MMNASLSYDPDVGQGNHSGMSFTWYYGEINCNLSGRGCKTKDVFTGVNESTIHYSRNAFGVQMILNTSAKQDIHSETGRDQGLSQRKRLSNHPYEEF